MASPSAFTPLLAAPLEAARRGTTAADLIAGDTGAEPPSSGPPARPYARAAAHRLLLSALLLSMTCVIALAFRANEDGDVAVGVAGGRGGKSTADGGPRSPVSSANGGGYPPAASTETETAETDPIASASQRWQSETRASSSLADAEAGAGSEPSVSHAPAHASGRATARLGAASMAQAPDATAVAMAEAAARKKQPHLVLMTIDDMGFNDIGYQSSDLPNATPHLSALALDGVRLDSYYGQQMCTPARATLMTGRWAPHVGLGDAQITAWSTRGAPLQHTLMPERLRAQGYATLGVGKWNLGHCNESYLPWNRGFDYFLGYYSQGVDYFSHRVEVRRRAVRSTSTVDYILGYYS